MTYFNVITEAQNHILKLLARVIDMMHKTVQRHRVNRVINYVQTNFQYDLNLCCLADVACLSKYHFVRMFDSHIGQTPLRYLNRIRLERAARQLMFLPSEAVGKIAIDCGFASHQSFTRAFSRNFGHPPDEFRTLDEKSDPDLKITACADICTRMIVRIENRPAVRIAYIRHFGSYSREGGGISRAACLIREWAQTLGLDNQLPLIGLCPDNRRITPSHFCIYDVGIPVNHDAEENDIVSILTIPAGRYAIGGVRCRNEQILSAWEWLCSTWRENHTEPYQQLWNYEVFHHSKDGKLSPERGIDLCLRLTE